MTALSVPEGWISSPADAELLRASGLVDEPFYRATARLPAGADVVRHYLEVGWQWDLQPSPDFDGAFLRPFYEAAGLSGPPLLNWVELSASGGWLPRTEAEAQSSAALVRASPEFDPAQYASRLPVGIDPALHYLLVGEALGWCPSGTFDPVFYGERNPDVVAAGLSPLRHFEQTGRREGRRARPIADRLSYPAFPAAGKQTVLVMAHEASRTGAPILGWSIAEHLAERYNVVTVLLRGGELLDAFAATSSAVVGPMSWEDWHPAEMARVADRIVKAYRPLYAISNSIETNLLVPQLAMRGVPSVALVHEFAAYTRPVDKMSNVFDWATDVVFPSEIVAQSSYKFFEHMRARRGVHVFAQGRVDPPRPAQAEPGYEQPAEEQGTGIRPPGAEGAFIVLGAGFVHIRKGVDLFLSVAAAVRQMAPECDVRFVWIGEGYDPLKDSAYSAYIAEQFDRAKLEGIVAFLPPVADLDPVYAAADAFFMCSRLDPQPNVGIDSVVRGLPVVCFEGASGTAEVLAADPETRSLVAPHLDVHAAAAIICRLAHDPALQASMRDAVRRVGTTAYNMDGYISRLDQLGCAAAAMLRDDDRLTLLASDVLDIDLALPPDRTAPGFEGLVNIIQQQWSVVRTSLNQTANTWFRRPCAGFHPQAYAAAHAGPCLEGGQNPLAHWLREGKTSGAWSREVFGPLARPTRSALRVALHGHFYHEQAAPELAGRLARNQTPCDLFLTTDTEAKAEQLRLCFVGHRGDVDVTVVPNRGRDIGPFLEFLKQIRGRSYDVVGHVHGKRSEATDAGMGERWRTFLWDNLVGHDAPMVDTAMAAFSARPQLGLLMAEDPHLVGWDKNRPIAEDLAARMSLGVELDTFFDFPLGTMFWARPGALVPLLELNLGWTDYPEEPVPYDGTILHALERLLPFIVKSERMTVAGLRVPGTNW